MIYNCFYPGGGRSKDLSKGFIYNFRLSVKEESYVQDNHQKP